MHATYETKLSAVIMNHLSITAIPASLPASGFYAAMKLPGLFMAHPFYPYRCVPFA
jgi:hypothetical protein